MSKRREDLIDFKYMYNRVFIFITIMIMNNFNEHQSKAVIQFAYIYFTGITMHKDETLFPIVIIFSIRS